VQKTFETLDEGLKDSDEEVAVMELFRKLKPGEIPRVNTARNYIYNLYFSEEKYDFSEVGRYKMDRRLDIVYEKYLETIKHEKKQKYTEESRVIKPLDILLAQFIFLILSIIPVFWILKIILVIKE